MKAVVFESLTGRQAWLARLYRLLGWQVYCLRFKGRRPPAPQLQSSIHVGSQAQRRRAIDEIDALWERRRPAAARALTALFGDPLIELALKKTLLFESVEGWRAALSAWEAARALPAGTRLHFVPESLRDSWRRPEIVPAWLRAAAFLHELGRRAAWIGYAGWHWLKLASRLRPSAPRVREWDFAVAVVAPFREWAWGMDFLLDGTRIRRDNAIFVPFLDLDEEQKARFREAGLELADRGAAPAPGDVLRAAAQTARLALSWASEAWVLEAWGRCLKEHGLWSALLRAEKPRRLVVYSDFLPSQLARYVLLKQHGVKTFYLTDSINSSMLWDKEREPVKWRHEYWCFLAWDVFVSWCPAYTRFQKSHPQRIGEYREIGALWAAPIKAIMEGRAPQPLAGALKARSGLRPVAAFDSSYHDHGVATYRDGILFLESLLRLVDDEKDILLILKEKNPRPLLGGFSFIPGERERMIELLETLERHPRCLVPGQSSGAAACIAAAEVVVSYPFTSTTILALGAGKKALFYDTAGRWPQNYFDTLPGAMIRGYDALRLRVRELLDRPSERLDLRDLEPYGDGRAVERLRDLLLA